MGSPEQGTSSPSRQDRALGELLSGFDDVLAEVSEHDREELQHDEKERRERAAFLDVFHEVCRSQVRPAMEAVADRLAVHGGGGAIEEHPGGEPRFQHPSLVLWMSLEGPIAGEPRADREPYLKLEANVPGRNVEISEGDIWRGAGGKRSGPVGTWELSEATGDRVVRELLAIARRAARPPDDQP